jgi:hypothetical protein
MSLANIEQAREAEPYLARFEDDWATGQILRQYINGKRKYENTKVKDGGKRNKTSPRDNDIEKATSNTDSDDDSGGSEDEDEDEWFGLNYPMDSIGRAE